MKKLKTSFKKKRKKKKTKLLQKQGIMRAYSFEGKDFKEKRISPNYKEYEEYDVINTDGRFPKKIARS